jgi:predicted nucleic acid-binding protein
MLELRTGVRNKDAVLALENDVFAPFERRRRVFSPSSAAFKEAGRIFAALAERENLEIAGMKASLLNDVLLAASCRELGVTLVTRDKDHARIKKYLKGFRHMEPWP